LKNAEFWLTKFLEWLKAVVPSQAGEDRRQREHVMNNGENTK
jgi:hypothetical protein